MSLLKSNTNALLLIILELFIEPVLVLLPNCKVPSVIVVLPVKVLVPVKVKLPENVSIVNNSECVTYSTFPILDDLKCEQIVVSNDDHKYYKIKNLLKNADAKEDYEIELRLKFLGSTDKTSSITLGAFSAYPGLPDLEQPDSFYSLAEEDEYHYTLGCVLNCNSCATIHKCYYCNSGFSLVDGKCL